MDQCEDREEGVPPSKTTLCGEDESQSKGQRIHQRLKAEPEPEPEPSCVSFKSDMSKNEFIYFKSPGSPPSERIHQRVKPEPEPEPSCVSFKSDMSKDGLIDFKSPGSPPSESVSRRYQQFVSWVDHQQQHNWPSSAVGQ